MDINYTSSILVIDNEPEMLEYLRSQLELYGIWVMTADSGKEALALLHERPRPDLILADVKMPEMDGLALLQAIRTNDEWSDIPFICMSGYATKAKLQQAFKLGADDFLSKPFDSQRLLEAVRRAGLHTREQAAKPVALSVERQPSLPSETPLIQPESTYAPAPASPDVSAELLTYLHVLWRRKWSIVLCTLVAVALSLFISSRLTPKYAASATVRISSSPDMNLGYSSLSVRIVNTYVKIATSAPVLDELDRRLNVASSPQIKVEVVPDTELLVITATHSDSQVARDSANTLAEILVERSANVFGGDAPTARELLWQQVQQAEADFNAALEEYNKLLLELQDAETSQARVTELTQQTEVLSRSVALRQEMYANLLQRYETARYNEQLRASAISIVEPAALPRKPSSPNLLLNTGLGLIGGLVAGIMLAFLLENFDTKLRNIDEIPSITPLPVLGQIPQSPYRRSPFWARSKMLPRPEKETVARAFHELRVRLMLTDGVPAGPTILITSPEPRTGKTAVSANLAMAMAKAGHRVAILDVDLRSPDIYRQLGLTPRPGIYDVLSGNVPLEEALQETTCPNLHAMTLGLTSTDVTGSLSPLPMRALLKYLQRDHDYIIVDAPSLHSRTYTTLLARLSDAVIMVVAQNHTDRRRLWHTLQQFREAHATVIGIVANRVPRSRLGDQGSQAILSEKLYSSITFSDQTAPLENTTLTRTG
jgi:capsular exopolysaccharide synthesis family protein